MEEDKAAGRIIIVCGDHHISDHHQSFEIIQQLNELGHEAVVMANPSEAVRVARVRYLADVMQTFPLVRPKVPDEAPFLQQSTEHTPPHGWYQQFAGKRGRPPRY